MKKMSRRQLLAAATATVGAADAHAPGSPAAAQDWAKVSREANQRNADSLAKVEVPIATEPAFVFKV